MNCIINLGKKYKSKLNKTKKRTFVKVVKFEIACNRFSFISGMAAGWSLHCVLEHFFNFIFREAMLLTCSTFPERGLLFIL